ncbi:carbohydrate ABC transporter permease [Alsobacter sp. SYSU BS001988]
MPEILIRSRAGAAAKLAFPYAVLLALAAVSVFPLAWMIFSSMKSYAGLYRFPPSFSLDDLGLQNYRAVIFSTPFLSFLKSSAVVALGSTILGTAISAMAAFVLARRLVHGAGALTKLLLIAYIFPPILIAIPLFLVINRLGLANTQPGLILVHVAYTFPFSTWMLISFFRRVPVELEEAARVDGASNLTTFVRITLPLVAPGLVTVAVFAFIASWNEFLLSLIILGAGDQRTLSVGLYSMVGGEFAQWGTAMAATTLAIIPTLLLFLAVQNRMAAGLTAGAVKG